MGMKGDGEGRKGCTGKRLRTRGGATAPRERHAAQASAAMASEKVRAGAAGGTRRPELQSRQRNVDHLAGNRFHLMPSCDARPELPGDR